MRADMTADVKPASRLLKQSSTVPIRVICTNYRTGSLEYRYAPRSTKDFLAFKGRRECGWGPLAHTSLDAAILHECDTELVGSRHSFLPMEPAKRPDPLMGWWLVRPAEKTMRDDLKAPA